MFVPMTNRGRIDDGMPRITNYWPPMRSILVPWTRPAHLAGDTNPGSESGTCLRKGA